ncbi:hypothetical protein [Archangium lipolyticum]|uniref:hypothetical protein n=1 Tax=Archangium lipolyticum TaxID=2970465 RepID=UPI00214A63C7|nr:hypothetical protein [Archangium lipolyticum]
MRHPSTACITALALTLSACDPETSESECGEPLYAGKATDEAWRAMVDARKKPRDSSRAVTLHSPTEGEVYSADATPPVWQWSSLSASLFRPQPPRAPRSLASWLGELLVPSAHAHLPPYTGDLYWVEVSTPGGKCPVVQVLTSEVSWQLDANSWAELGKNAGKDLTVQVTSAHLLQNTVTEGPYSLATPRTFRRGAP